MKATTLQRINIDNIVDVMVEPNKYDVDNHVYRDVYSVLEKNSQRKKIDEGDYKALLKIIETRRFQRSLKI